MHLLLTFVAPVALAAFCDFFSRRCFMMQHAARQHPGPAVGGAQRAAMQLRQQAQLQAQAQAQQAKLHAH